MHTFINTSMNQSRLSFKLSNRNRLIWVRTRTILRITIT